MAKTTKVPAFIQDPDCTKEQINAGNDKWIAFEDAHPVRRPLCGDSRHRRGISEIRRGSAAAFVSWRRRWACPSAWAMCSIWRSTHGKKGSGPDRNARRADDAAKRA